MIKLSELEEGQFYAIKLKSHLLFPGGRLTKEESIERIQNLGLKEDEIDIDTANLPFAYLYDNYQKVQNLG